MVGDEGAAGFLPGAVGGRVVGGGEAEEPGGVGEGDWGGVRGGGGGCGCGHGFGDGVGREGRGGGGGGGEKGGGVERGDLICW